MKPQNETADLSDQQVVEAIRNGNKDLFEVIVRRYNSYLYKIGRSYGFEHDDVEDLMEETYVNAYTHLRDFENRSQFKTWIVRIMLNQCYHKKQKSKGFENRVEWSELTERAVMIDNSKPIQNNELKQILEDSVLALSEDYRMVFSLREMLGHSTAETAELLKISESNVKVRLNRAKQMLRNHLNKKFPNEEIFEFHLSHCDGMVERVKKKINNL